MTGRFSAVAMESKSRYCAHHNYTCIFENITLDRKRHAAWAKLLYILVHFATCEEVFYMDSDVIITNTSLSVEAIMGNSRSHDLVMCRGRIYPVNTGMIYARKTAYTVALLGRAYGEKDFHWDSNWEQEAVSTLIKENAWNETQHVHIWEDNRRFNSYCPCQHELPREMMWRPGDFVLHFAGVKTEEIERFMTANNMI